MSGWVHVERGAPPVRITLRVTNREVAATWAARALRDRTSWGEVRGFSLRLRDVWDYVDKRSRLTIRADGVPLPVAGHGMFLRPARSGAHSPDELAALLADGHVFSHEGVLQLSKQLDLTWQRRVLELYAQVRAQVVADPGYAVFLVYGSLLGAVREGGYIGHDNDFDAAYISAKAEPAEAARELQEIGLSLLRSGAHVRAFPEALHIYHPDDPGTRIDLFHLYIDEAGQICFPYGVAGNTSLTKDDWRGTQEIDFPGGRVLIPVNADQVVEHIYGSGWREPDPGFDWDRDRRRRAEAGVLPTELTEDVYWGNFYARNHYDSGSPFQIEIAARPDTPAAVVDIGCGDGRDAVAFAAAGRRIVGLDRSEFGIKNATEAAARAGVADRTRFLRCDVSEAAQLRAALGDAVGSAGGPVLFYLRFFLHSIPESAQETLMSTLSDTARPGDCFAAEFRTDKDADAKKVHGAHYRRFQNGPAFGALLRDQYRFQVLTEQEGSGLSPYRGEDPDLYRVFARREH